MNPLVSIIIPTFNCWKLTKQCLLEIRIAAKDVPHEIIVVDNNSTDETVGELLAAFPEVKVIANNENLNFSHACNQGAQVAKGEHLYFLNNDTVPFNGFLSALVDEFNDSDVAIVGSKLIFPDGTIQHAGVAHMRETRFPYHPYRGLSGDHPFVNHRREVQAVTGASFMVRRNWFGKLQGFNEQYVNGGEDIHFCIQVFRAGGKVIYQPKSALVHLESQSPGRMKFNEQNCRVFYKHWQDDFISDEDAFYFEDGVHRTGMRTRHDQLPLTNFKNPEEERQWKFVAMTQQAGTRGKFELFPTLLGPKNAVEWPVNAAVHEWAAVTACKYHLYEGACVHFKEGLRIRATQSMLDVQDTLNMHGLSLVGELTREHNSFAGVSPK